jgi:hypothetical protein
MDLPTALKLSVSLFAPAFLLLLAFLSWTVYRRGLSTQKLVLLAAWLLIFIPTFGPGYSPQYVYWFLPLLVLVYSFAASSVRRVLIALYLIAAATYILEYGFGLGHGAFIYHLFPSDYYLRVNRVLESPSNQTFIRLPLFTAYLVLVAMITRSLRQPPVPLLTFSRAATSSSR